MGFWGKIGSGVPVYTAAGSNLNILGHKFDITILHEAVNGNTFTFNIVNETFNGLNIGFSISDWWTHTTFLGAVLFGDKTNALENRKAALAKKAALLDNQNNVAQVLN
jgi:hypothetical protein